VSDGVTLRPGQLLAPDVKVKIYVAQDDLDDHVERDLNDHRDLLLRIKELEKKVAWLEMEHITAADGWGHDTDPGRHT